MPDAKHVFYTFTRAVYNKMDAESRSWGEPHCFDAPLTPRGQQQALALRDPLAKLIAKRGVSDKFQGLLALQLAQ